MRLSLVNNTAKHFPKLLITQTLRSAARVTQSSSQVDEVIVSFVNNPTIKKLNNKYRKINRVTDILSFTYRTKNKTLKSQPKVSEPFGELVIAIDQVAHQAKLHKRDLNKELSDILIHGYLHLLGHDHHKVNERIIMRQWEDRIKDNLTSKIL